MDRDFGMAMDGYIAACREEEQAIQRYFLLPDMENHHVYMQATMVRRKMLRILLERHADYIVHIVEEFRGIIGKDVDALVARVARLEQKEHHHDATPKE